MVYTVDLLMFCVWEKGVENVENKDFGLSKLLPSATPGKCCVYLRIGHDTFLLLPSPLTV